MRACFALLFALTSTAIPRTTMGAPEAADPAHRVSIEQRLADARALLEELRDHAPEPAELLPNP